MIGASDSPELARLQTRVAELEMVIGMFAAAVGLGGDGQWRLRIQLDEAFALRETIGRPVVMIGVEDEYYTVDVMRGAA